MKITDDSLRANRFQTGRNVTIVTSPHGSATYNRKAMPDKKPKNAADSKVLIVEDDVDLNAAYEMIVASAGYTVTTAFNGEEALDAAKTQDPDIIFLDLRMPKLDGIGFLEKYDAPSHDATVVVFSNYDAQAEVDRAFALGADRYVLKARAAPNELIRIIEDIIAGR